MMMSCRIEIEYGNYDALWGIEFPWKMIVRKEEIVASFGIEISPLIHSLNKRNVR